MTQTAVSRRSAYREALSNIGYEILPFIGTFENVLEHVPQSIPLTVTASPQKGLEATIDLTMSLAAEGYVVTPHLSARLVRSRAQLNDILSRLTECGVHSLFVIGGDGEPQGPYTDALGLLCDLHQGGHHFDDIGIAGYPDGHAIISDHAVDQALKAKAPLVQHIATQMCFDAAKIQSWTQRLTDDGITLPVRVGVPGAVSRQKLLRISTSIGVGDSVRFVRKQQSLLWRFFVPGGYNPASLMRKLAPGPQQDRQQSRIAGFHLFTFNDLKGTEQWRTRELDRHDDK